MPHSKKLLMVVVETLLEKVIIEELTTLGVHGYTTWFASGGGVTGSRSGETDQDRNTVIHAICSEQVANQALEFLSKKYFKDYAMIAYIQDVTVIRSDKF